MKDLKARIKAKIPKEELKYGSWYDEFCQKCKKTTSHYGSLIEYLYCSECGFVTSDDMDETVEQLDLS